MTWIVLKLDSTLPLPSVKLNAIVFGPGKAVKLTTQPPVVHPVGPKIVPAPPSGVTVMVIFIFDEEMYNGFRLATPRGTKGVAAGAGEADTDGGSNRSKTGTEAGAAFESGDAGVRAGLAAGLAISGMELVFATAPPEHP